MSLSSIFGALNRNIDSMTVVRGLKILCQKKQQKYNMVYLVEK